MGDKRHPGKPARTEPRLGDLDQLDSARPAAPPAENAESAPVAGETRRPRAAPPARKRRTRWPWLLIPVMIVILAGLAWVNQDYLRSLLPRTQLNTLLVRADKAYAAGHLEGSSGDSARELYEAVQALEPDNQQAHDGLHKVGEAELARARKAIQAGEYDQAQSALDDARELLGGGDQVDALAQQLLKAQQSQAQTNALITQAQQALAQGHLDGDQGAAKLYRQALKADPDNAVARHGLDKVGDAWARQARDALDAGKLDQADTDIARIASLMPGYGNLPALRARLSQAQQQTKAAVDAHLKKAQDALRAGHFSGDGDDNALAQFQAVLKLDPDNAAAKAGVGQVAQSLILRANASMDAEDAGDAANLLQKAAVLEPHSAGLAAAQSRLKGLRRQLDHKLPQAKLDPRQQAKVDSLLKRAKAALVAGDIMLPPGASAYDLYSQVLNIDSNNSAALDGLQGLAAHATTMFDQALHAGDLARAEKMLDVLGQLVPGDAAQAGMRHRLAGAWLDRAQHNLDAGNKAAARQALDAARKLRPDAPRLQALRSRIDNS
jgi:tetratricopeptide (TPR) repeat protein